VWLGKPKDSRTVLGSSRAGCQWCTARVDGSGPSGFHAGGGLNLVGYGERLRMTLGFESSSGPPPTPAPEPGTLALLGLVALGLSGRCKRT